MITFDGSFVPSITTVFPAGGADLSGVVTGICVGAALYCFSFACAVATPGLELAASVAAAVDEFDEFDELEDPQAANAAALRTAPASATERRLVARRHLVCSIPVCCFISLFSPM
jgi:hypothetical protein